MDDFTHENLKKWVNYNPITGVFTWNKSPTNSIKIGDSVGNKTNTGYMEACVLGKRVLQHRLAFFYMTGIWPADQIDHKNMIRSDNRWDNLREATNCQNTYNRLTYNKLGLKNVYYHPQSGKYNVKIVINGKTKSFGYYSDVELADLVAREAREKYLGEFARHDAAN